MSESWCKRVLKRSIHRIPGYITVLIAFFLAMPLDLHASYYMLDHGASSMSFRIKHLLIFEARGSFDVFDGTLYWDPQHLDQTVFKGKVIVNSINAGHEKYDRLLMKPAFFNEAVYPEIRFESQEVTRTGVNNEYLLSGILTAKGTSLPIHTTIQVDPSGLDNETIRISATLALNRIDYQIASGYRWPILHEIVNIDLYFQAHK